MSATHQTPAPMTEGEARFGAGQTPASPTVPLGEAGPRSSDADAVGAPASEEAAFWAMVDRSSLDGCWPWLGSAVAGRGRYKNTYAYRRAWELANGRPVPDGLFVCHHCDNPICVRPDHLYAGTHKDNVRDAINRGRYRPSGVFGLAAGNATVPPEVIREAVAEYLRGGVSQATMAERLGVGPTTFGRWVRAEARRDTGLEGVVVGVGSRIATGIKPCGTRAGWFRHRSHGEPICDPCREANRIYMAAWKANRKASLGT